MSQIPDSLRYAASHEWVRVDNDLGTVGITDHAQAELSDVVYVDLPKVGAQVKAGAVAAVIESVGTFGGFSEAGPFFNVQTDTLDMHILHEEIDAIYAVEKWGHDTSYATYSFQFFDRAGEAGFEAFLWEDYPDLPARHIATFHELVARFSADSGS